MFLPIPAIDIINGQCVRLSKGDYDLKTVYPVSPLEVAQRWETLGVKNLHIVDLDRAKGQASNAELIMQIAQQTTLEVQTGGGIRSQQDIEELLMSGVKKIVIGSLALKEPATISAWVQKFGAGHIIIAADVKNEKIAFHGWQEVSQMSLTDFIKDMQSRGVQEFLCTDIERDGMFSGVNTELYTKLQKHFPNITLIASGGVKNAEDFTKLSEAGIARAVVGKAFYEGKVTEEDIRKWYI